MKIECRILRANQVLKKLVDFNEYRREWRRFYGDMRCDAQRFPRLKSGKLIDAMTAVILGIGQVAGAYTVLLADLGNPERSDAELIESERHLRDSLRTFIHDIGHFQVAHATWQTSRAVRRECGDTKLPRWISSAGVLDSIEENFQLICTLAYETPKQSSVTVPRLRRNRSSSRNRPASQGRVPTRSK